MHIVTKEDKWAFSAGYHAAAKAAGIPDAPRFGVVKRSDLPREEQRKRPEKPPLRQNLGDLLRQAGVRGRPCA